MYDNFKTSNYANSLVSPEQYARHLSRLFTGDVIDGLTVVPGTGLQTVLQPGTAFIRYGSAGVASAREVALVATFNLTHGTPDASNPRNDLVVLYVDNAVSLPSGTPTSANLDGLGVAKAKIVPGTAAATPVDPSSTAIQASVGAGNPYVILQRVRVDNGVSVIASNKITDIRRGVMPLNAIHAPQVARIEASEATATQTFGDNLGTVGPLVTLNVPPSGVVSLSLGGGMSNNGGGSFSFMGFVATGANTISATDNKALRYKSVNANDYGQFGESFLLTGLTPGITVFKAQYRTNGNISSFVFREISVVPL